MPNERKTVLITGCSSGFGKLTAKLFSAQGWNVFATMRSPEKEEELTALTNVVVARLDVTDGRSIDEAVAVCLAKFGGIDVLVNNAGVSGTGVFEQWSEKDISSLFEADVFGLMRVTKAVLPTMRQQGAGVVVNVSSLAGHIGMPFSSVYSAAKFAVEGLTEALAVEYAPLGVAVKAVAPGSYQTNLYNSIDSSLLKNGDAQVREYATGLQGRMNAAVDQMAQRDDGPSDPQEVADKIFECATGDTPIHNVSGADAEDFVRMKRSVPEAEMVKLISDMLVPADFRAA